MLDADGAAVYARSGHLLFARQGELLAQSFDVTRLALQGEPFRVADSVSVNPGISLASLSASASGPIAYGMESIRRTQFAWFDRSGRRLKLCNNLIKEAWPILRCRPTAVGLPSAASWVATGTFG